MSTIRRIYAYLLAFAGLAMFSIAAANLVQLLVDVLLQAPLVQSDGYVRDSVALNGAAALVGLPVWLVHWLWMARTVRLDPKERASTLRRLYLYAVLAGATLEVPSSATEALRSAFSVLVGSATPGATLDAIVRPLPFALVAFGVWLAHWRIAASDRAAVGEHGGAATLRRWYLYGAAVIGLLLLLTGTQGVVESVWRLLAQAGGPTGEDMPRAAAGALVGLGLWLVNRVLRLPAADKNADDASVLRSVTLFLSLAIAVVGTLLGLSQLLYYAVARLLGVDHPGGIGGDLLQAAAGPASTAIVYGAAWAAYAGMLSPRRILPTSGILRPRSARMERRPQDDRLTETRRQAGVRRLYTYLVALVALGVLAGGVAGLLWTLGDVVLSAPAGATASGWREQVALYATLAIVGLPVWLRHWPPHPESVAEARSLARRLHVYLSLIVAMLALVGSAAAGLYTVLGLALGGTWSMSTAVDLAHALAVASVAAVLAAYQFRVLRTDATRAASESVQQVPSVAGPVSARVEIHAVDAAALCAALKALRSTGVQVNEIS